MQDVDLRIEFGRVVEITLKIKKGENKTKKKVQQKGNWRNGDFIFTMRWMRPIESDPNLQFKAFHDSVLNTTGFNWMAGADFHII